MGEEVEVLKDHTDFGANFFDVLEVVGQLDAVDPDLPALMLLQPVDTPDQGGFTRTRGTADDDPLLPAHGQVDVLENMKILEPFVHVPDFDDDIFFGVGVTRIFEQYGHASP